MAQDLTAKYANFISNCVAAAAALKAARDTLLVLDSEWNNSGLGSAITNANFTGSNSHMTLATLTSLFTTQGNLETFWAAGNGTNVDACIPS